MVKGNKEAIDLFLKIRRQKDLAAHFLPHSYFAPTKRTIRKISTIKSQVMQNLKDVENIYGDIAGFDMSNDEFDALYREARENEENH